VAVQPACFFRGEGLAVWLGLLGRGAETCSPHCSISHLFDFHAGWMYVLGVRGRRAAWWLREQGRRRRTGPQKLGMTMETIRSAKGRRSLRWSAFSLSAWHNQAARDIPIWILVAFLIAIIAALDDLRRGHPRRGLGYRGWFLPWIGAHFASSLEAPDLRPSDRNCLLWRRFGGHWWSDAAHGRPGFTRLAPTLKLLIAAVGLFYHLRTAPPAASGFSRVFWRRVCC